MAESFFKETFESDPFYEQLGFRIVDVGRDSSVLQLHRKPTTPTGIGGSVNGGVLATLMDMTAVSCIFAELREGEQPAGTADLQITYLRQAGGEVLTSTATVVKRGRQLATINVEITDDQDRLCCTGRVLYAFRA